MQFAVNVENIENANFVDFGTYTVDWDSITVTITYESTQGDDVSYTDVIEYTIGENLDGGEYLTLFTDYEKLSGNYDRQ